VYGVQRALDTLAHEHPVFAPQAEMLRALVARFELRELIEHLSRALDVTDAEAL
jgi:hypothetical protein